MNLDETTACHAMLVAQWPSLGGDDELGDVRVTAWYHALRPWSPEVAFAATELIIASWDGAFPPRVADWIRAARATGERLAPRPLPDISVDERVTDDFVRDLLSPVRARLSEHAAGQRAISAGTRQRLIPEHQEGDMLTYDEVYGTTQGGTDGND